MTGQKTDAAALAALAAQQAAEHSPYDGYMTPAEGGLWQVAAGGAVIGSYPEETARAVLTEHAAGRPCWKVPEGDGDPIRIA